MTESDYFINPIGSNAACRILPSEHLLSKGDTRWNRCQAHLIDMIESETPEMAQAAAQTLRRGGRLEEKQRKRLTELKQKLSDPKLVKDIDEILKASEGRPVSIKGDKNHKKSRK